VRPLRCEPGAFVGTTTDYSQAGPHGVATIEITFDDPARPIVQTALHPAAQSRTLVTTIYYPTGGRSTLLGSSALASGAPFPLVMYSHGYSSGRNEAQTVASRLASYGYVVVAPDFPLSNMLANDGNPDPSDAANQPGDVSFLIDRVLELSRNPRHVLANAVDETRIGATGVSMGGLTTLLVALHPVLQDRRVKAALPIAALSSFFLPGFYHTRELPLLFLHGDTDAFIDYELNSRRAFESAMPNAHLVTLERGTHAAFAVQFDASTIALLNDLLGKPGAHPSNPDGFGCGAVADALHGGASPLDGLGGRENFVDDHPANGLSPCDGDEYKKAAMDPAVQVGLTATTAAAFFEAQFAFKPEQRQEACNYILQALPRQPGVKVE
jgi:dienelactone hydrolase